jgi:PadR family transcriptional regulator AphA
VVKLAADGLLEAGSEGVRERKIYTITPEGWRLLREWLVGHQPSMVLRSEVALQAFLLPLLDRDEAIAAVERIKEIYSARLTALECERGDGMGSYALKLGLSQIHTALAWADETLADLRKRPE